MKALYHWASSKLSSLASSIKEKTVQITETVKNNLQLPEEGLVEWASGRVTVIMTKAKQAATIAVDVVKFVCTPSNIQWALNLFLQAWEGFSRFLHPSTLSAFIRYPKTRQTLLYSALDNFVFYLSADLLYQAGVKPLVKNIPYLSQAEFALDLCATAVVMRLSMRRFIDNRFYNLAIAKAVGTENHNEEQQSICQCGEGEQTKGRIASAFYFMSNLAFIKVIAAIVPFGEYLAKGLRALAYGQALTEYQIGAPGMCTKHRNEILSKNNAYSFGIGTSLFMLTELFSYLIQTTTGAASYFIYDALFAWLFQYHIMLSLLQEKPLPGEKCGTDVFYYGRVMMQDLFNHIANNMEVKPGEQSPVLENSKLILSSKPVRYMNELVFDDDFQSLEKSIDRFSSWSSIRQFFDVYAGTIRQEIKKIFDIRNKFYMQPLKWASPFLPDFIVSQELKKKLDMVMAEELGENLALVNYVVNKIEKKSSSFSHKPATELKPSIRVPDELEIHTQKQDVDSPSNRENWDDWTSISAILNQGYASSIVLPATKENQIVIEDKKEQSEEANIKMTSFALMGETPLFDDDSPNTPPLPRRFVTEASLAKKGLFSKPVQAPHEQNEIRKIRQTS